jgi:hypothetical protein
MAIAAGASGIGLMERAGALHQPYAGRAGRDRHPVGGGHFDGGQQFRAAAEVEHGAIVAPPARARNTAAGARRISRFALRVFVLYARTPGVIPDSSAGRAFDC